MSRLILDAGAFVAYEKGEQRLRAHLVAAHQLGFELVTSAAVVAQVWRNARQVRLARLLSSTRVDAPDEAAGRRAGELLAATRTTDVVDALVVVLARAGDSVITSDPDDLRALAAAARIRVNVIEA